MTSSSSFSSGSSSPLSNDSGRDDIYGAIVSYDKEPEWKADELLAGSASAGAQSQAEGDDEEEENWALWPPASRVGNNNWCQCGECSVQPKREDCVCCWDYPECKAKINAEEEQCITALETFTCGCARHDILSIALTGYLDLTKRPLDTSVNNE